MKVIAVLLFVILAQRRAEGDRFCGVDLDDAQNKCWQPCSTDSDCCAISQRCFETGNSCRSADLIGANHFFCGVSWCDASYNCGNTPCPTQTECPEGQTCFADIPCNSESPEVSAPPLPVPPTAAPYQFCGSSISDAKNNCWQPCPRGKGDCCFGLECFDTSADANSGGTCTTSEYSGPNHYFCGNSWCDAAYSCNNACPGGTNEECPQGQYCYADVPCFSDGSQQPPSIQRPTSIYSKYCGESKEDAAQQCWQPCRDNSDCCAGQTCHSEVTTCPYPDNIGADHYFCGTDSCDAAFKCPLPCPTGFDAQCPNGQRCFANTPCNANIRTRTADTLEYGLPEQSLRLMQQYKLDEGQGSIVDEGATTNATTDPDEALPVGLIFGICIICLLALSYVLSRCSVA